MSNDDDFLQEFRVDKQVKEVVIPSKSHKKKETGSTVDDIANKFMMNLDPMKKSHKKKESLSSNDTKEPAYGQEAHALRKKITEYGILFPEETKALRAIIGKKKDATIEELQKYVEELDILVGVGGGMDAFILDSLFSCIETIEGVTKNSRYNLVGLAKNLKENEVFMNLAKRVYIKYSSFAEAPIELQLLMSVGLTTYITIQENKNKNN